MRPAPPWAGVELLVLARAPGLAARLEACLSPHVERACAFEDFGAAYDHAKKTRTVGFLLAADDLGLPLDDALAQLAKPYEARGWPCLAAVVGAAPPAPWRGARLLDALPLERMSTPDGARAALRRLWTAYVRALEDFLLPEALQRTLLALAEPGLPRSSALFTERLAFMLGGASSGTGLTWFELLGVRWLPVAAALERLAPAALAANPGIDELCGLAGPSEAAFVIASLEGARSQGRLEAALDELARGPDTPLRVRVRACRRAILRLAAEVVRGEIAAKEA